MSEPPRRSSRRKYPRPIAPKRRRRRAGWGRIRRVTGRSASRRALTEWYRPRRRAYPWRVRPTPYRVLVSEVMLQQTQAGRVVPSFQRFVARFPSVAALARAPRSEVVRGGSGLGYNRRAVALSEAARAVAAAHGGRIPRSLEDLRRLPGVG